MLGRTYDDQVCSVARALEVLGERWTLLVVRDALGGLSRFEEFQESLMKISNSTVVALDELWAVSDSSGDQVSLLDTLHDPDAPDPQELLDASELKDRLADAIAALPEREKLVIALYYYENLTLREIGEVLGVTESRISQLHTKAVLRLKSRLQGDNLRD